MKIELSGHYSYSRILKTCIPSVLMILTTSVYSIVDGLFVSNFAGTTSFAALNIIWPAIATVAAFGLMFGTGGSALVAMVIGQDDRDRANGIFTMLIRAMLILGAVCGTLLFIFMRPVSIWLGADEAMLPDCIRYGRILVCAMPAFMSQMAFNSFFMTAEKPQLGTLLTVICGITNIAFDALFIVVFGWGLTGAAIATVLGMAVGGIYPLYYFSSKKRNTTKLKFVKADTDWHCIVRCCSNGLSEYVGNIALNIVSMCYNLQLMKLIGQDGVAVYGILMYIGYVYASVYIGYNIAVSPIVSFNYGAQNHDELKSLLRKSIVILLVAGTILTGLSEILSSPMAGIFVGYDPGLKALTARAIRIYMISFMICGLNMFVSAWFTALNNGIVSACAAFARTLVFEMGAIFILPLLLGLDGVWLAVDVADMLALVLAVILLSTFRKRYNY